LALAESTPVRDTLETVRLEGDVIGRGYRLDADRTVSQEGEVSPFRWRVWQLEKLGGGLDLGVVGVDVDVRVEREVRAGESKSVGELVDTLGKEVENAVELEQFLVEQRRKLL
jgi:hypothetical protein